MSDYSEAIVYAIGARLYSACLVGNPCPKVAEMYERMTHPQPGDLCIEVTSFKGNPVGVWERACIDPEGLPIAVIRNPDGTLTRWGNCRWVAIHWPKGEVGT